MKYKLKATKERKEQPSSQSLLLEGGHTEETLNYMFDPKEQSKFRNDNLQSKIKNIYNKYEKSLKVDINKKSSVPNSPGVKNQSPTVKRQMKYVKFNQEHEQASQKLGLALEYSHKNLDNYLKEGLVLPQLHGAEAIQQFKLNDDAKTTVDRQQMMKELQEQEQREKLKINDAIEELKFDEERDQEISDLSNEENFNLGSRMDINPNLLKLQPTVKCSSTSTVAELDQNLEKPQRLNLRRRSSVVCQSVSSISNSSISDYKSPTHEKLVKLKNTEKASYADIQRKVKQKYEHSNIKHLEDKLKQYAEQISREVDENHQSAKDKIKYLNKLQKTPLQRHFQEISQHQILSREIIEFDKNFFQTQMKKIGKAYEVELRGEEAKSRSKAIKYIELNLSNAKDQLQKEMSHLFAQLQASNNTVGQLRKTVSYQREKLQLQEVCIAGLRSFAECDRLELKRVNSEIGVGDKEVHQVEQDKLRRKYLKVKDNKQEQVDQERLLHQSFSLFSSQISLTAQEKLNLIERELIKVYQLKNENLKQQLTALNHELELAHSVNGLQNSKEDEMQRQIHDLKSQVEVLSYENQRQTQKHLVEMKQREQKSEWELSSLQEQYSSFKQISLLELEVHQQVQNKCLFLINRLQSENQDLKLKLKIPRLHYKFLEEHGTLDEFMDAKKKGNGISQVLDKSMQLQRIKDKKMNLGSLDTTQNQRMGRRQVVSNKSSLSPKSSHQLTASTRYKSMNNRPILSDIYSKQSSPSHQVSQFGVGLPLGQAFYLGQTLNVFKRSKYSLCASTAADSHKI